MTTQTTTTITDLDSGREVRPFQLDSDFSIRLAAGESRSFRATAPSPVWSIDFDLRWVGDVDRDQPDTAPVAHLSWWEVRTPQSGRWVRASEVLAAEKDWRGTGGREEAIYSTLVKAIRQLVGGEFGFSNKRGTDRFAHNGPPVFAAGVAR